MRLIVSCSLLLTLLTLPRDTHAAPGVCKRWINYMDPCDGVVASPACNNPSSWTEGQRRNYNNWNYTSSADTGAGPAKACQKLIRKHITENSNQAIKCPVSGAAGPKLFHLGSYAVAAPPFTEESYLCTCDRNQDGVTTAADLSYDLFPIDLIQLTPEPICFATPNGPYARVQRPGGGEWPRARSGGQFSEEMRLAVLGRNAYVHGGTTTSDLQGQCGQVDPFSPLLPANDNTLELDDDPDPDAPFRLPPVLELYTTAKFRVQVDHIIPRIDIQGCPCGTNGVENTLILSGGLNGQTSNLIEHPARQAILHTWTNYVPAVPPNPDVCAGFPREIPTSDLIPEDGEVDLERPVDDESEVGGCSTTSGAGALLGLALLFLPRRRRT